MRIVFLCGGLAPERDGVGDYTRYLAAELIRQGHGAAAIALNDSRVSEIAREQQSVEGIAISVLRLPGRVAWRERVVEARNWLETFNADWTSLQFVPFGFHPKGFCVALGKRLAAINSNKPWHIMFHELWRGANQGARVKERLIGRIQKFAALSMVRRLKPAKVHTSNLAYQGLLRNGGIEAGVLPLFGNIAIGESSSGWMEAELLKLGVAPADRKKFCVLGIFGAIPAEWAADEFLTMVEKAASRTEQELLLLTVGIHSAEADESLKTAAAKFLGRVKVASFGFQSEGRVSEFLQNIDYGVATGPWSLLGKSGTTAAMLEHGLPVLVLRDDVDLGVLDPGHSQFIKMPKHLEAKMRQSRKLAPRQTKAEIAGGLVEDLRAAGEGFLKL